MRRSLRKVGSLFAPSRRRPAAADRVRAAALIGVTVLGLGQVRADDDVPELTPPLDTPAAATPPRPAGPARPMIVSTPLPASPAATTRPAVVPAPKPTISGTSILAMPGLTVPATTPRPSTLVVPDEALGDDDGPVGMPSGARTVGASGPGLTLDGPMEMPEAAIPATRGQGGASGASRSELVPIPGPDDDIDLPGSPSDPGARRATSTPHRLEPAPAGGRGASASTITPPARRGRFFGLWPAPGVVTPAASAARPATVTSASGRDVRPQGEGTDSLDSAQATLKTRIEKQARQAVGDRVRSIEVHVDQKTATIQARGVKFIQKRSVRKSLEALPALSGLRSTIEILD